METNVVLTLDESKKSKMLSYMNDNGVMNTVIMCNDFIEDKIKRNVNLRQIVVDFINNKKEIIVLTDSFKSSFVTIGYPYEYNLNTVVDVFDKDFKNKVMALNHNAKSTLQINTSETLSGERLLVSRNELLDLEQSAQSVLFYEKFNNVKELSNISRHNLVYDPKKHVLLLGFSVILQQQGVRFTAVNANIEKATDFRKLFTILKR